MANSLGSLYIDITARTAQLEQDMGRVKSQMAGLRDATKQASDEAKKGGSTFDTLFSPLKMVGMVAGYLALRMAIHAIIDEVKFVVMNIEQIPNVSAEAVDAVQRMKAAWADMRNTADGWIAKTIAGAYNVGQTIKALTLLQFGQSAALKDMLTASLVPLDKLREANDPLYWKKVTDERTKLVEAQKAEALAAMDTSDKIIQLRKDAEAYTTISKSSNFDTLTQMQYIGKAFAANTQANKLEMGIKTQYAAFVRQFNQEEFRDGEEQLSQKDKILELNEKIGKALVTAGMTRATVVGNPLMPLTDAEMDAANKKFPQLLQWMAELRGEMNKLRTASMEWRDLTVSAFNQIDDQLTSLVTNGQLKISDFLKTVSDSIISMFFKLAVINPLLNAMFGSTKGFAILPAMFGMGAKADGGPARGLTLVGERGPEVLNIGSGSTIIPNHQLSGKGAGDTYYLDARGADEKRIAAMERAIMAVNGTVERRAFSAVATINKRRGSRAAAIGL